MAKVEQDFFLIFVETCFCQHLIKVGDVRIANPSILILLEENFIVENQLDAVCFYELFHLLINFGF
jgi:hypothetical protein